MDCPPIGLLIFNRPDLTALVFERIRAARPPVLILMADGPREGNAADRERCAATRSVVENVDWPCEVHRKYEERNLGCGRAASSGFDFVFEHVERAVLLEDDCLPDPSFFGFCAELLERYEDDDRVMQIAGTNFGAPEDAFLGYSYALTSFSPVWGWATWRRAWAKYDYAMRSWPEFRETEMTHGLPVNRAWRKILTDAWDRTYVRTHDGSTAWDWQWQFTVFSEHGLSVIPAVNLVSNLGFRPDASQTATPAGVELTRLPGDLHELPVQAMDFPLRHPPLVSENPHVEAHFQRKMIETIGTAVELFRKLLPSHRLRRTIKAVVRRSP